MSVRVNLLRLEERRLYTAVGRTFMIKLALGAAGALLVVFCLLALYNLHAVIGGLRSTKAQWSKIEKSYGKAMLVKKEYDDFLVLDTELAGWSNSRVDWLGPLQELQRMVPTNVQLTALSVSSKIVLFDANPEEGPKSGRGKKTDDQLARVFSVRLDGKAFGDLADQVVVRFVDDLRGASTVKPWLQSLGLQGLQRAVRRNRDDADGEWIFRIEAESSVRALQ